MSECGGAPILKVNGKSLERLKATMSLAHSFPATGYVVDQDGGRIVLFWSDSDESTKFPVPLGPDQCAELVYEWLQKAPRDEEPDHDGHNSAGWLCYTEGWGHIEPYGWEAFLAIEPHWVMYGK